MLHTAEFCLFSLKIERVVSMHALLKDYPILLYKMHSPSVMMLPTCLSSGLGVDFSLILVTLFTDII